MLFHATKLRETPSLFTLQNSKCRNDMPVQLYVDLFLLIYISPSDSSFLLLIATPRDAFLARLEKEEGCGEAQSGVDGGDRVLGLEEEGLRTERGLLGHLSRVRDASLVVAVQELLAIWHRGWRDRIRDGGPHGGAEEDPGDGWPPGVGDHALQDVVGVEFDDEALVGDNGRARDAEPDEQEVEDGLALDQDRPHADEQPLSQFGITFVEGGAERSGGLEGSS